MNRKKNQSKSMQKGHSGQFVRDYVKLLVKYSGPATVTKLDSTSWNSRDGMNAARVLASIRLIIIPTRSAVHSNGS
jgi:hypothetical protein